MLAETIFKDQREIASTLERFGVSLSELRQIALTAVSARNEATPLHPVNAPGMYSYMAGVAAIRKAFLGVDGWKPWRNNGIEGVESTRLGKLILFQNVDVACGVHYPNPVSAKGEGMFKLVDNPTAYLWDFMAAEDSKIENMHIWFYCVSSNGDEFRAELSRPRQVKNGNFGTFSERIFLVQDNDWLLSTDASDEDTNEIQDFDVPVSRKE